MEGKTGTLGSGRRRRSHTGDLGEVSLSQTVPWVRSMHPTCSHYHYRLLLAALFIECGLLHSLTGINTHCKTILLVALDFDHAPSAPSDPVPLCLAGAEETAGASPGRVVNTDWTHRCDAQPDWDQMARHDSIALICVSPRRDSKPLHLCLSV
jgi:hypothetical protein